MVHLSFRAKQGLSIHETSHSSQQLPAVCHNISTIIWLQGSTTPACRVSRATCGRVCCRPRGTRRPTWRPTTSCSCRSASPARSRPGPGPPPRSCCSTGGRPRPSSTASPSRCSRCAAQLSSLYSHNIARTCSTPRCPGSAPPWWRWPRWPGTRVSAGAVNGSSRNFGIILCYLGI